MNTTLQSVVAISYLVSSIFFIFGIKRLSHPKSAPRGNRLGAVGMLIASLTAFVDFGFFQNETFPTQFLWLIAIALIAGSAVGIWTGTTVKMTGMPQMVAIFNGFGGAASFLVAGIYYQFLVVDNLDT